MKKLIVFAALALLVFTTAAAAQSPLADAARREAERRKALEPVKTPNVPTFTNEDLAKLPQRAVPVPPKPATEVTTVGAAGSTTAPGAAAAAGAPAAGQPAADATKDAPKDEKYWRERITEARTKLSRAEIFAESLQSRINALSADLVNRDDPAQRARIGEERQRALTELARVQAEVGDFKKAVADIEDEARRLGVPAGWLR
jgi:hypothetical protein